MLQNVQYKGCYNYTQLLLHDFIRIDINIYQYKRISHGDYSDIYPKQIDTPTAHVQCNTFMHDIQALQLIPRCMQAYQNTLSSYS